MIVTEDFYRLIRCLDAVYRPSSLSRGPLSTGKAWRSVNKMQLEAPLQRRNVTLRRRRHPADGNYAGVSLACLSSCLSARVSVCLTQSVRFVSFKSR